MAIYVKETTREDGYYWVKTDGDWFIGYWVQWGGAWVWYLATFTQVYSDDELEAIDEKRIERDA